MKSKIHLILFFVFCSAVLSGQIDYRVIKVNGSILLKAKGISLETGTVFKENEDLLFRTEDATAAVINSQKGRLVLTSSNHDLSSAKSNYLPSMYNISSRGARLLTASDISNYFSGRIAVFEKQSTQVDNVAFPLDRNNFFFLRYKYNGEEINKKLPVEGNSFIIEKTNLLTVDGLSIPRADNTKIKLFYRRGKESVFLSEFDLIFPDMDQLTKETEIILGEIKNKSREQKIQEVGSYITEMYGKIPSEDLSAWLEKRFGVK